MSNSRCVYFLPVSPDKSHERSDFLHTYNIYTYQPIIYIIYKPKSNPVFFKPCISIPDKAKVKVKALVKIFSCEISRLKKCLFIIVLSVGGETL